MIALRNDGASFGGLSYRLISPRARVILLSFIYFYLLLIAGAFGNVVVSTAVALKAAPMAWLFLTVGGILAGQMIYRWKKDIIMTTVVTVVIAMCGIWFGTIAPSDKILGESLANSRALWTICAFVFCYFAAVLPIWRFALPINYVASYIVFWVCFWCDRHFDSPSEFHSSRHHLLHHQNRTDLAHHVRNHRLRSCFRVAQPGFELGHGASVGERNGCETRRGWGYVRGNAPGGVRSDHCGHDLCPLRLNMEKLSPKVRVAFSPLECPNSSEFSGFRQISAVSYGSVMMIVLAITSCNWWCGS